MTRLRINLGARITLVIVALLVLSLGLTQRLVERENIRNATDNIEADLQVARGVFSELLGSRSASLLDIVRPATRDHAFRMAYNSEHVPTLESAMRNLMGRINQIPTDLMLITSLEGESIAVQSDLPAAVPRAVVEWLIDRAYQSPIYEATGVAMVADTPHQLVITPMLIPAPDAWIIIGFPIDEGFLQSTASITRKGVSVLATQQGQSQARLVRSDLPADQKQALLDLFADNGTDITRMQQLQNASDRLLALFVWLDSPPGQQLYIALHDSLAAALQPWREFNRTLGLIFVAALTLSLLVAVFLGHSLSAPIRQLTQSVKAIAAGDYQSRAASRSADEVGQLATAFNQMAQGLQEREKVRSLLGKVVSEDIAQELLRSDLELGGEERELTVLFCDVRNFTSLCEGAAPEEILGMLNQYFSVASDIIEQNQGVVDKYMGDAIMALFGAPVATPNHARCALQALLQLRRYAAERDQSSDSVFSVGLGVATGLGVVGNMGSVNRLNYTVIGDSVNLAARLESLTRFYGVDALVSEATCQAAPQFRFRQIDRVQVKGKTRAESVYQPLDDDFHDQLLALHRDAMASYFAGDWPLAIERFGQLAQKRPADQLYPIYVQRCTDLRQQDPADWDGVQRFQQK